MAPSTSNTTQAGPSGAAAPADVEVENTIDELEHLVQFLLTTQNPQAVLQRLKTISKADSREQLIAGVLPSGQDPLDILDPEAQTLGYLYILLSVSYCMVCVWALTWLMIQICEAAP